MSQHADDRRSIRTQNRRLFVVALFACLVWVAGTAAWAQGSSPPEPWVCKMSFADAAKPYAGGDYVYNLAGFVNPRGVVTLSKEATKEQVERGVGMGCNAYANAVLHRMRYGKDWLKHWNAKVAQPNGKTALRRHLHYGLGDEIPPALGLDFVTKVPGMSLMNAEAMKKLIGDKAIRVGLYYFDARRVDTKGKFHGHVGFLRITTEGRVIQSHYSGLRIQKNGAWVSKYNGLASGSLSGWLGHVGYKHSYFDLYFVPEK